MVEFIAAHPCLYNKKLRDWTNKSLKDRIWQEQADKMGKPVGEIKTWYDSIRTRLGRLRKTKSGQGDTEFTERDRWIYDSFQFLCPHIVEVQRRNVVSLKSKIAAAATASAPPPSSHTPLDGDVDCTPVDDQPDPSQQTQQDTDISPQSVTAQSVTVGNARPRRTHAGDYNELMSSLAMSTEKQDQLLQLSQELIHQMRPTADKERTHFSNWVTSILHQLPRELYRSAQKDICSILERARDEQDRREIQQQQHLQQQPLQQSMLQQSLHQQQGSQQPYHPQQRMQQQEQAWQPPPTQWPQTLQGRQVSVWGSQDPAWMQQQFPNQQFCDQQPRSSSCPSVTTSSPPRSTGQGDRSYFNLSSVLDKFIDAPAADSERLQEQPPLTQDLHQDQDTQHSQDRLDSKDD